MPLNKTLLVFNSLNSKEKKMLNNVMEKIKKNSLKKLHYVIKNPKKAEKIKDKSSLFKQIMDTEYDKKKDYLLRNEIRLYNNELKKIISLSHFQNNDEMQQKAFINELSKRNLDDLLRLELNKKITEVEKNNDYSNLDFFYQKRLMLLKKNLKYTNSGILELKEALDKSLQNKLVKLGEEISEIALYNAFAERVLFQFSQKKEFTNIIDNENLFTNIYNENLAYLNKLKAQAYQKDGSEKINVLEETLTFLNSNNYEKINSEKEKVIVQVKLGTEYMLLGNYEKSVQYFEQGFESKDLMDKALFIGSSLNYVSAMLKAKAFEKAIQFILENNLNEESQLRKRMLPVLIICFILGNNLKAAENLMPLHFDKKDLDFYHYLRLLQCIIFYENELYELAENEAENLKRHLESFKEKSNQLDNIISELLIQFIKLEYNYIEPKKTKKRNNLKEEVLRFSKQNKKFDSDGLVLLWLKKKLLIE